jgi:hypothetical protein
MPRQVSDLLVSWVCQAGRGNIMEVWRLAPLCLMWCFWREQNYVKSFEDVEILVL